MTTTTPPQQRIEADVKAAMKAGEKERLSTLRMLLTEIKNERIRRGSEVDEAGFVSLVRKSIKQREESIAQYRKGNREELAAKEEAEIKMLEPYLPAQVDEGQIRAAVEETVAAKGLSGPAAGGGDGPPQGAPRTGRHRADHEGDARQLRIERGRCHHQPHRPRGAGA